MTQTKKYGWTLTLITALLSCGSGGEEAVNTGPLLSQEGTSQGGLAGKLAPEESTKSDTRDSLSVAVSESTDSEREADASAGTPEIRDDSVQPDTTELNRPAAQKVEGGVGGGGGGSFMEWKDRLSTREVLNQKSIDGMERGWIPNRKQSEGQEELKDPFSSQKVLQSGFERIGKTCALPSCADQVDEILRSFGFSEGAVGPKGIQTGNWLMEMGPEIPVEERIRLLDAALQTGPVLLQSENGFGWYAGSATPGGKARALMAKPQESGEGAPVRLELVEIAGEPALAGGAPGQTLRAALFAEKVGSELQAAVQSRPTYPVAERIPRKCKAARDVDVVSFPKRPYTGNPVHWVVSLKKGIGPHSVRVFDRKGKRIEHRVSRLEGPPAALVITVDSPARGGLQLVVGEEGNVEVCNQVTVGRRSAGGLGNTEKHVWKPVRKWNNKMESLFGAFVEHLFSHPMEDDRTWESLTDLITDPNRNFLYNALGHREDEKMKLAPDCADLPYFLRAYFAWKMRLPFAYHRCTGGTKGRPPVCQEEFMSTAFVHEKKDGVSAFKALMRKVASGVHSGNTRTLPTDSTTDFYPVEISREAIRPGTIFVDPYGHVLVVSKWVPQPAGGYGILMAGDAQPDATVGRRRFWKGSFLFDPSTEDVGAGFKAFRPVRYDKVTETFSWDDNKKLQSRWAINPLKMTQYQGTEDEFYDQVEAQINPRPLNPVALQVVLVDALQESVNRRINSVNNAENYTRETAYATIEMPERSAIFQTSGPWEDFSTPSRDMRLLISLDTVVDFPDKVARAPDRFGAKTPEQAKRLVDELRQALDSELKQRSFEYIRSDGTTQQLSLHDVRIRARAMEMAYNPNDCVERRWGAEEGSEEYKPCKRFAPEEQRAKMREYRPWFESRKRPARGY